MKLEHWGLLAASLGLLYLTLDSDEISVRAVGGVALAGLGVYAYTKGL